MAQYLMLSFTPKFLKIMEDKDNTSSKNDREIKKTDERKKAEEAFEQAEEDIEKDPELNLDNLSDLDEGELARKEGHP